MSGQDFDRLRRAMVSNQLRPSGVSDVAVLTAMDAVPREKFVEAGQGALAYRDTIVPLGDGRGLNPPVATGRLLDAVEPAAGERVLLVGGATGYVAALFVAIGCAVTMIDDAAMIGRAKAALGDAAGISFVEGALAEGAASGAPYDILYVDGAIEAVPEALVDQLREDGRAAVAILERGISRLSVGRRVGSALGLRAFADVETVTLPGFAPAPVFSF